MKKLILLSTALLLSVASFAQTEEEIAMQQKWMEYMTPGEMHKMMTTYNGRFTTKSTMWFTPGAPATESTGAVTNDMYMGDRYQKSIYSGDMMGMPFKGEATMGYDNARKVFVSTWIDNMGTGIMYGEGEWNAATKSIETKGTQTDAMTDGKIPYREVLTFIDEDHYRMEMYNVYNGEEYKSMEILYERVK